MNIQESSQIELQNELKQALSNAHNIATTIYNENRHKGDAVVIKLIKDALRNIRFNDDRGYFFIYERKGKNILHPKLPHFEGKDFWNYQDSKGTYLLQEMKKILATEEETVYFLVLE